MTVITRAYLADGLEGKNYHTLEADSGQAALDAFQGQQPDLVLLDIKMRDLLGYDVCWRFCHDPVTILLPVILMTGVSPEERVKGIEARTDDLPTKPINCPKLFARAAHSCVSRSTMRSFKLKPHSWVSNRELRVKLEQETKLAEVASMVGDIGHNLKIFLCPF